MVTAAMLAESGATSAVATSARASTAAALVFGIGVILVIGNAPPWCVAIGLASVAWRVLTVNRAQPVRRRAGARFLLGALTAALVVAVAMSFRTLNGLAAGTALLVVMGALKVFESRARRDDAIVIGVALFLLLAAALAGQALWRLPLYLLAAWAACTAIALVAHAESRLTTRAAMRLSARTLLMAIPLALACFAFFPRVAGQFWALQRVSSATTGLSDQMSPGSIDKIANEYDPVFRVRFEGTPPPRTALYWRGPVLNDFDGFTWRRVGGRGYLATPVEPVGPAYRHHVTLEPTYQSWLFALDTIDERPRRDMYLSHDRQLTANLPVTSPMSYDAVSHIETRSSGPLSTLGRRYETRLPADRNPRARALARDIRARTSNDVEYSRAVLEWFRTSGLEYTLEPGRTSLDSVDSTLFDSKKGFCGHFASAYATLMRAEGVPARIVTGYLGGEWNPVGGYVLVRQSEAHAWTEVWLDGRGWTRVDPTAVVAPERLQRSILDLMPESLPATSVVLHQSAWFRRFSQWWDGVNHWWQDNVVEFDLRAQFNLLQKLGIDAPGWQHLGWAFALGLAAWMTWVALSLRRSVPRVRPDRIARAWLAATRKLARIAPRGASEGPLEYAGRIGVARPDLATPVAALAARYARLRFGPSALHADVIELEREVRELAV
jgi:transglutaminase-like putative cysteine protease